MRRWRGAVVQNARRGGFLMPAISGSLKSPFEAQIAFFRRKVNVPTARWADLWREHHAHGFMVAGLARADLLEDMRQLVARAQAGQSLSAFKAEFGRLVDAAGWEPRGGKAWRAKVIYDTNVRQAFNAGRYAQLTDPDMLKVRPYWMYQHSPESKVPRPLHKSWHGTVLRHDDPWWKTHMPMNGWGCKCRVRAVSKRDIEREGLKLLDRGPDDGSREWIDKFTGETHMVPNGIDPGFDYNVGQAAASLPAAAHFGERVLRLPPAWRDIALGDALSRRVDWFADWPGLVHRVEIELLARAARPTGVASPIGFLPPRVMEALRAGAGLDGRTFTPVQPSTALVAATDRVLYHALRDTKHAFDADVREALGDAARDMPEWIADATHVLWNAQNPALLFARPVKGSDDFLVLVVRPDYLESRTREPVRASWVRSIQRYSRTALKNHYIQLTGAL